MESASANKSAGWKKACSLLGYINDGQTFGLEHHTSLLFFTPCLPVWQRESSFPFQLIEYCIINIIVQKPFYGAKWRGWAAVPSLWKVPNFWFALRKLYNIFPTPQPNIFSGFSFILLRISLSYRKTSPCPGSMEFDFFFYCDWIGCLFTMFSMYINLNQIQIGFYVYSTTSNSVFMVLHICLLISFFLS